MQVLRSKIDKKKPLRPNPTFPPFICQERRQITDHSVHPAACTAMKASGLKLINHTLYIRIKTLVTSLAVKDFEMISEKIAHYLILSRAAGYFLSVLSCGIFVIHNLCS
jgi:hypothetical protein